MTDFYLEVDLTVGQGELVVIGLGGEGGRGLRTLYPVIASYFKILGQAF